MEITTFRYNGREQRCTLGRRELHCGDCFQLKDKDAWLDVRIELSEDWIIIGANPSGAFRWHRAEAREYPR